MSQITTISIDEMCAVCAHAESGEICDCKDSPEFKKPISPFHVCTAFTQDESMDPPYPTEGESLNLVELFLYEGEAFRIEMDKNWARPVRFNTAKEHYTDDKQAA